jgi:hypothetical protein
MTSAETVEEDINKKSTVRATLHPLVLLSINSPK